MQKYNSEHFYSTFLDVGLKRGDMVLVHNSLFSFGIPTDVPLKELSSSIYKQLRKVIGEEGTIAVPTFNFDFCKGIPFYSNTTPSKNMGVFSEYIRMLPTSLRSKHPMQSIAVVGPLAEAITNGDPQSAFGEHGAFDVLLKNNAKILLLGTDYNAASFIHMVEEHNKVPYRYWKSFTAPYGVNEAETVDRTYQMYVRDLEVNPILNMNFIEEILVDKNLLQKTQLGAGFIHCIKANDYVLLADELIKENPYCFVSNHKNEAN
ncbi:aminoglycoside N(3)-acetyltransferase [Aureibaculum marinum]|uniref:Aminoglycoside N(3)-acetyltransferase n=1 Tax=Aureibaculum marinum TaxID=2487930 RepID=A0A3N4N9H7_9FLAO|nr:AAC(3) family N-acetyltransferase [Aureibaculum marinum]RPD91718.1 aminoglycoside N(3)-acetyltransferase [Aureibaculum marinum]